MAANNISKNLASQSCGAAIRQSRSYQTVKICKLLEYKWARRKCENATTMTRARKNNFFQRNCRPSKLTDPVQK